MEYPPADASGMSGSLPFNAKVHSTILRKSYRICSQPYRYVTRRQWPAVGRGATELVRRMHGITLCSAVDGNTSLKIASGKCFFKSLKMVIHFI